MSDRSLARIRAKCSRLMNELKPPMLKREDYKAIKHMNREDLTKYLYRIYRRGFDAGVESTKGKVTKRSIVSPEPVQTEE